MRLGRREIMKVMMFLTVLAPVEIHAEEQPPTEDRPELCKAQLRKETEEITRMFIERAEKHHGITYSSLEKHKAYMAAYRKRLDQLRPFYNFVD